MLLWGSLDAGQLINVENPPSPTSHEGGYLFGQQSPHGGQRTVASTETETRNEW